MQWRPLVTFVNYLCMIQYILQYITTTQLDPPRPGQVLPISSPLLISITERSGPRLTPFNIHKVPDRKAGCERAQVDWE